MSGFNFLPASSADLAQLLLDRSAHAAGWMMSKSDKLSWEVNLQFWEYSSVKPGWWRLVQSDHCHVNWFCTCVEKGDKGWKVATFPHRDCVWFIHSCSLLTEVCCWVVGSVLVFCSSFHILSPQYGSIICEHSGGNLRNGCGTRPGMHNFSCNHGSCLGLKGNCVRHIASNTMRSIACVGTQTCPYADSHAFCHIYRWKSDGNAFLRTRYTPYWHDTPAMMSYLTWCCTCSFNKQYVDSALSPQTLIYPHCWLPF